MQDFYAGLNKYLSESNEMHEMLARVREQTNEDDTFDTDCDLYCTIVGLVERYAYERMEQTVAVKVEY